MSPISIEPNRGVRLQLTNYTKTRSFQGGGEFWETQFQQIIRQCLGDFLPRADQDGPGSVLFQHFVGSEEVCSKSEPIDGNVPIGELQRIERCIQVLKAKEADPQTDSNARKLIQAFKLPDPAKDPELYRVYGSRMNRKLIVLWGVEKESLSSLDPMTAVSRVRQRAGGGGSWQWLWWLLALLLLLLIGWLLFQRMNPKPIADTSAMPAWTPDDTSRVPGLSRHDNERVNDSAAPSAPSAANNPDWTPPSAAPGSAPSDSSPGSPRAGGGTGDGKPSSSPDSRPPSTPSSPPPASSEQAMKPGANSPVSDRPASSSPDATASSSPSSSPNSQSSPPSSQPNSKTPDSKSPNSKTPAPGGAATPPPEGTPPTALDAASGTQPKLEIINVSHDDTLHDGKVKIELKAVLRDASGQPAKLSTVTEWDIDGKPQMDAKGKKSVGPAFISLLPKGSHRIEVIGTSADGKPLRAAADIEVGIQSSVRFKSAE